MNIPADQSQRQPVSESNNHSALSVDYAATDSPDVKYYTNSFEKIAKATILLTVIGVPIFVCSLVVGILDVALWLWLVDLCCWVAGLILGAVGIAKRKSITHNQLYIALISVCLCALFISALLIFITVFAIAYGAGHL